MQYINAELHAWRLQQTPALTTRFRQVATALAAAAEKSGCPNGSDFSPSFQPAGTGSLVKKSEMGLIYPSYIYTWIHNKQKWKPQKHSLKDRKNIDILKQMVILLPFGHLLGGDRARDAGNIISGVFDIGHIKILIYPIVIVDTVIFDIGRD